MSQGKPAKSEGLASKAKSKKRPRDDEPGARKKRRKSAFEEDELLFDMEAGVNKAIGLMDSQLMADHIAQKTSRFGTDLSPVELSDLYISRTYSLRFTPAFY
jgi:protein CMS1